MEVLTTRGKYFRKKLDNELNRSRINSFYREQVIPEVVKKNLEDEWIKHSNAISEKFNKQCRL